MAKSKQQRSPFIREASELERDFLFYWRVLAPDYPLPICLELSGVEYAPIKGRRFLFDFAWLDHKIAVEAQGGLFMMGGHTGGTNMEADYEKNNLCVSEGWRMFYVSSGMLKRDASTIISLITTLMDKSS